MDISATLFLLGATTPLSQFSKDQTIWRKLKEQQGRGIYSRSRTIGLFWPDVDQRCSNTLSWMPSDTRGYYSAVTDIAGSFSSELASHPRPLQVASLSDKGGLLLLNMPKNTHFCYIAKYLFCSMVSVPASFILALFSRSWRSRLIRGPDAYQHQVNRQPARIAGNADREWRRDLDSLIDQLNRTLASSFSTARDLPQGALPWPYMA